MLLIRLPNKISLILQEGLLHFNNNDVMSDILCEITPSKLIKQHKIQNLCQKKNQNNFCGVVGFLNKFQIIKDQSQWYKSLTFLIKLYTVICYTQGLIERDNLFIFIAECLQSYLVCYELSPLSVLLKRGESEKLFKINGINGNIFGKFCIHEQCSPPSLLPFCPTPWKAIQTDLSPTF